MQSRSAHTLVLHGGCRALPPAQQQARREAAALADAEALLASGSPPVAVRAGLRLILDEQLGLNLPPGPAGLVGVLGWLARHRAGPLTAAVAALSGQQVTIAPDGPGRGTTLGGAPAWVRTGQMLAGGQPVASVSLTVIPDLAGGRDGEEMAALRRGVPCGTVFPGLRRAARAAAWAWPADPPLTCGASLYRQAARFGVSREEFTTAGARLLAGQ